MASKKNGILYIGVTDNLIRRVFEHREGSKDGFTKKYWVKKLVYFEETPNIESAIKREKQIKRWKRDWKIELIEGANPEWKDLYFVV
ncbi:GIY-YIG nuclease family protein [candidate division WS5 bacterium]|uniref:GIY-YIG nuclease family protein n=1 Tax=candidate division WS5 bacterium TaxID=2093353 RepID=A0A419DEQ7_9BACT|nr:MAG: GIY-YIG nuclease family protein [candidate division WS5 bacterium]